MRRLIVSESVSLDGVFEGPVQGPFEKFARAGWTEPYINEEHMQYVGEAMSGGEAIMLGRVTYAYFEASWSPQSGPMADAMNNLTKYVVSKSLKQAGWRNSTLINGNVVEEIRKLKQQPGKDIAILGSGGLIRSLMAHGLIDEYSLLVFPVVVGAGKRLFGDQPQTALKLTHSRTFRSGVVLLTYVPDRE